MSPKKGAKQDQSNSDLNQDIDFDLDAKLIEALKRHRKETKEQRDQERDKKLKQLEKKPKLTNKSVLSIQNHIQRMQTTGSVETLDRQGGASGLGSS